MMGRRHFFTLPLGIALLAAGCARLELKPLKPRRAAEVERKEVNRPWRLTRDAETRILALQPDRVTEADVRGVLKNAPAPRIINIHGGIEHVQRRLAAFSKFLIGMGYPENAIRFPGTKLYTISCYEPAELFTGTIAWFYEHEGMRPMMLGHSQGGIQAVKVLQRFASPPSKGIEVWSPLTWASEHRTEITDPLSGKKVPASSVTVSYVASLGAGGITRVLPNQWDMLGRLRAVPDTVDEFTGFYLGMDLLGGDYLGFGSANRFHATGHAHVRNVELPSTYSHAHTPELERLLHNRGAIDWINNYVQSDEPHDPENLPGDVKGIVFGADVWKSVKRHWVIELQRLIRARRARENGR